VFKISEVFLTRFRMKGSVELKNWFEYSGYAELLVFSVFLVLSVF